MTKREKERLLKLANFLQKLPKKLWDFNLVAEVESCDINDIKNAGLGKPVKCKTVACAMGWCPTVFPRSFNWEVDKFDGSGAIVHKNTDTFDFYAVAEFFGITYDESLYLFDPSSYHLRGYKNNVIITSKDVAREIKAFVKRK